MTSERRHPRLVAHRGVCVLGDRGEEVIAFFRPDLQGHEQGGGHQSHGVLRLPWYAARLASGAMTAHTEPETLVDGGALLLLDGRAGVGQVLADIARREAVARAREHGVGVVGVRDSNHFGTAMYYTRRAAQDGCVAILTTNASPAMAPWGGRQKVLGTNPWSIAAPSPTASGVVAVDIANTAVARG